MEVNMDVTELRELVKTGMVVVKAEPLPVRPESAGWVSVNDELPKEGGKYRVIIQRGSANVTTEETETLFFKKEHRSYWGIGGDWDVVTHWNPDRVIGGNLST